MSAANTSSPKPKPRWGQFGLRTLFVLITLASACVALFAYSLERAKRQAAAVSRIQSRLGGPIACILVSGQIATPADDESDACLLADVKRASPWTPPHWVLARLGIGMYGTVTEVSACDYNGNDDELADFKLLSGVKRIDFHHAPHVTDEGLAHLERLSSLEYVKIGNSQVTDAGLARLRKALPKCQVKTSDRE